MIQHNCVFPSHLSRRAYFYSPAIDRTGKEASSSENDRTITSLIHPRGQPSAGSSGHSTRNRRPQDAETCRRRLFRRDRPRPSNCAKPIPKLPGFRRQVRPGLGIRPTTGIQPRRLECLDIHMYTSLHDHTGVILI